MNTIQVAFIKTQDGNITLILGAKNFSVGTSHPNYALIVEALKNGTYDGLETLLDIPRTINARMSTDGVTVQDGQVLFKGVPVHNTVCDRILQFMNEGLPHMPLVRFLENLMQNPSSRAVNELYDFLEHRGFPITEDGCFIGYKGVRDDWKDAYSGTIDNSIGQKPRVTRNQVDDNRENECSWGLHVGTLEYARNYCNQKMLLVKVNPADAVSVPKDHDASKLRVCGYEVIAEAPQDRIETPMYPMPTAEPEFTEGEEVDLDEDDDEFDLLNGGENEEEFEEEEEASISVDPFATPIATPAQRDDAAPKRPACTYCGAKGGKRHDQRCNRP